MAEYSERTIQSYYWKGHSVVPSVEAVMLDSQASELDLEERPEILSLLPPFKGKDVIELGEGIGWFSGELAKTANHVLAMDFTENFYKKNKDTHGHYDNIQFECADVTSPNLNINDASADLVFSNWLLMYLSDEEVASLTARIMKWLRPGGFIFFRESCFHQSGDLKRKNNPSHYRQPSDYTKVFEQTIIKEADGCFYEFELVGCKCVGTYVRNKRNQNQVCWLWKKVPSEGPVLKSFQKFLDTLQYTKTGILRYERIFGEGFVGPGGMETIREFVNMLDLKAGHRVLDVGCGIGGVDFYMAEEFDAEVVDIDLYVNMICFALERSIGRKCAIEFEVADCTKINYPDASFDVTYSRDTILHVQWNCYIPKSSNFGCILYLKNTPALFSRLYKWLKPGGRVLISDYCRAPSTQSEEFAAYIQQRGYDLHSVQAYGQMLQGAGFTEVVAEDRTDQFVEVSKRELVVTEKNRDTFIADFSEDDYNYIVSGWESKLKRFSR